MSELLPRPAPLSLSLINDLWSAGGSVDLALRSLGLSAQFPEDGPMPYVTAYGRLYCDVAAEARITPKLNAVALRRIRKSGASIAKSFSEVFAPALSGELRVLAAADFNCLPLADLVTLAADMRRRFVTRTYVDVDVINIVAQIYLDDARAALEKAGLEPLAFLDGGPETEMVKQLAVNRGQDRSKTIEALQAAIGHRARFDYELSEPRFGESEARLLEAAAELTANSPPKQPGISEAFPGFMAPGLVALVERARTFQTLKEDAKHLALRELANLRRLILAIGAQSGLGGDVFYLTFAEIEGLHWNNLTASKITASGRRVDAGTLRAVPPLATTLTRAGLERGPYTAEAEIQADGALKGVRVSGRDAVQGRARVVSRADCELGAPIAGFSPGDILVAPMLHPSWLPELVRAGGVVCEIGGWLSHMAIVARERGVAMITGVTTLSLIQDGASLVLETDGRISFVVEAPEAIAAE